jgi:uncharacterized protein
MTANSSYSEPTIIHNVNENRFEIGKDGVLAVLEYSREGEKIIFTHTGVPPALEGQGIASRLARAALEYARVQRLKVVPLCSFVSGYIRKHPEYADLLE